MIKRGIGMQIIDRLLELLNLLSKRKEGYMISEISEHLSIPISSIHRMLACLKKNDYVVQDPETKKYKLSWKVLHLAVNLLNNNDIRLVARPYLERLSLKYEEMVFLSIMENNRAICIDTVMSSDRVKFYVKIGSEMPMNAAVAAQVILAYLDEEMIEKILCQQKINRFTLHTLTNIEEIKKKLECIRKTGYGLCDEELEAGVNAIAVPIRDYSGSVAASITMVGIKSKNYINENKIQDLKRTASEISIALGYQKEY
ncbi:IclR family transcriptional regulator [Clostridiaceae bacterium 35-E11]